MNWPNPDALRVPFKNQPVSRAHAQGAPDLQRHRNLPLAGNFGLLFHFLTLYNIPYFVKTEGLHRRLDLDLFPKLTPAALAPPVGYSTAIRPCEYRSTRAARWAPAASRLRHRAP